MSAARPVLIEIATDNADGALPALLWVPEGAGPGAGHPGMVVFQEIFGLSAYLRRRCADLAALGYVVLAPQLYARLTEPVFALEDDNYPDPQSMLAEATQLVHQTDWAQAVQDGVVAMQALHGRPEVDGRVGLGGFCFGGGLAFDVAATSTRAGRPPAALLSYYGSALPKLLAVAEQVNCPSLHIFGTEDSYIPAGMVAKIREAVTAGETRDQVRFELHEGAGHAFDNPNPMFHHPEASAAAWVQSRQFLAEHLPVPR